MKIFNLLRIPLVRWFGIVLILYFALFANKNNPQSLGHHLSKENIKKSLDEAQEKSRFIAVNVKMAQERAKMAELEKKSVPAGSNKIEIRDLEIGKGEKAVTCDDEVQLSYVIQNSAEKEIESQPFQKIIIGSKNNSIIEQNILGMKEGGIRVVTIPYEFQTDDKKISELLKFNAGNIRYIITLLNIKKSTAPSSSCL